jgi:hypothetical protein
MGYTNPYDVVTVMTFWFDYNLTICFMGLRYGVVNWFDSVRTGSS